MPPSRPRCVNPGSHAATRCVPLVGRRGRPARRHPRDAGARCGPALPPASRPAAGGPFEDGPEPSRPLRTSVEEGTPVLEAQPCCCVPRQETGRRRACGRLQIGAKSFCLETRPGRVFRAVYEAPPQDFVPGREPASAPPLPKPQPLSPLNELQRPAPGPASSALAPAPPALAGLGTRRVGTS